MDKYEELKAAALEFLRADDEVARRGWTARTEYRFDEAKTALRSLLGEESDGRP